MSKEILLVVDAVSNEKGVGKEIIFGAMEAALASAAKKLYTGDVDLRVAINRRTGDYTTFRRWQVIGEDEEMVNPDRQMLEGEAVQRQPDVQTGDFVEEQVDNAIFGRIAAQTAKQVIVQKVREAERAQVVDAFIKRKGELLSGIVKRIEKGDVILDLGGNVEAKIPREEMIPREQVRNGDRLRGYLKDVRSEPRGPQLFISRVAPELLTALFTLEVPEIGQEIIEIMGAARDPGVRAKIAVHSKDPRIDPVGACVGMRGSRVQSVSNELAGERVDIVLWDANPAQYVIKAMSPAEVLSIVVDEDAHSMDIVVAEEKLSQAIGKSGQNVRLASELTSWDLNVLTEEQATARSGEEEENLRSLLAEQLGIDDEIAAILVREGFVSLEEVAYVPIQEMLEVPGFNETMVEELRNRARDALLTRAIAEEEQLGGAGPADDLLQMEGMDEDLAFFLAERGIPTMEDLAELSVDDLTEMAGLDDERAARLIMTARAPWFSGERQG
ncbi:MAG: transcription termination/antitermination protein NusA [Gammaproteobacteria bacterium]|nr:transcription termination/antitermination protein NusA [Gammaproteobacteria bacterium]MCP5425403.1 transcription termination/antitermination protein NusA [Gammaproteobacteria bacterium]MCP5459269.1 transcription termination/antitermination protein NusA [Gammaproteobacteria bacterium]